MSRTEDVVVGVMLSPDILTPLLNFGYQFLGNCVPVTGMQWEIKKLEKAKIACHAPMFIGHMAIEGEGEYIWQIEKAQIKRAYKILGGAR